MSVDSDTAAEQAAAAAAANPGLLGLPITAVGALPLALFLVGYNANGSLATLLAVLVVGTGISSIITSLWAQRLGAGPVAAIFGIFSAFWLSLAALLFGITHYWFSARPADPYSPEATAAAGEALAGGLAVFGLVWLVAVVILTLATLRLPLVFTLLFLLFDVALLFVFLSFNGGGNTLFNLIAGIAVFGVVAVLVYLFFDAMGVALGGKGMPMGSAVMK